MDDTNATGKSSADLFKRDSQSECWGEFPASAWTIPSKAVVAQGIHNGSVLWTAGPHIRMEIEETGLYSLEEIGLGGAPVGISIWEGSVYYASERGWGGIDEGATAEVKGTFREPTEAEWACIRAGGCPWSDRDWGREHDWGKEPEEGI